MNKFTKKDFLFSVVTGLYSGAIAWQILKFLQIDVFDKFRVNIIFHLLGLSNRNVSSVWMMLLVPILWIVGVNLGYFLGKWMPFFNQFGRFAAVGFTNFAVYSGILNLLIALSGINSGVWYSVFVSISFIMGMLNSFVLNKHWVFSVQGATPAGGQGFASGGGVPTSTNDGAEFGKFFTISVVAGLINVIVASFIVNFIHPIFGITPNGWANVGGIAGSAVALIFSFIGFKMVVFKEKTINVIS